MPTMPQPPIRRPRPFMKPRLVMLIWGDTMYGVHINISWRNGNDLREVDVWTFTPDEMLVKLRKKLERYLR